MSQLTVNPFGSHQYVAFVAEVGALVQHLPQCQSKHLRHLSQVLSPEVNRWAVAPAQSTATLRHYAGAGFQVEATADAELATTLQTMRRLAQKVQAAPPQQLVVVTPTPAVAQFWQTVAQALNTPLQVWVYGPADFSHLLVVRPRPLASLLPNPAPARVQVFVDMENIWIGLQRQGWRGSVKQLVQAIKNAIGREGLIKKMVFYADWKRLDATHAGDLQRDLVLLGHEAVYLVSRVGKNSVDLRIADDLHALVQKPNTAPDAVDTVVIASGDLDLRVAAERAKTCGKKVVVLSLQDSLSAELRKAAGNVRHLERHLAPAVSGGCA